MKNIKSIEEFLFESKATAKKRFLDRGLIDQANFDWFLEVDITPTKKFIEKMCEFFVDGEDIADIVNTFEKVISLSNRQILNFDISLIKSLSELQNLISEKEGYQSRSEKNLSAQQGAEVVYSDDRFLVLYITTEEASKKYGKETTWCISAEKDNQWDEYYTKRESRFYFIIDKTPSNPNWKKLAVQFEKTGRIFVYNSLDNKSNYSDYVYDVITFNYVIDNIGVPVNIFNKEDHQQDVKRYINDGKYIKTTYEDDTYKVVYLSDIIPLEYCSYGTMFRNKWNDLPFYIIENKILPITDEFHKLAIIDKTTSYDIYTAKGKRNIINIYNILNDYKIPHTAFNLDLDWINSSDLFRNVYGIKGEYTINEDGEIDVDGSVFITRSGITEIPVKFGKVTGDFWCERNNLTTLKNAPNWVGRDFDASENMLTDLEGSPEFVGRGFYCSYNPLESLKGAPKKVDWFICKGGLEKLPPLKMKITKKLVNSLIEVVKGVDLK